jgi:hypothetical protein
MQVLEGGRGAVNRIYNRIASDPRHSDVELLSYEEIDERRFAGWSMGQVEATHLNPAMLLKYSETAVLDPYAVSGAVSLALCAELVATAAIMGQVNLSRLNPALVLKYSETAVLDPYAVSGAVSLALCAELVATAAIVGQG